MIPVKDFASFYRARERALTRDMLVWDYTLTTKVLGGMCGERYGRPSDLNML